jgi:hypothetical protein
MSFTNDAPLVIALASMAFTNTAPLAGNLQGFSHCATNQFHLTGTPVDGSTVTIGSKVYTFQDTLTNVDGNVKIGANPAACVANLIAAINLAAGAGTTYATAMTLNADVHRVNQPSWHLLYGCDFKGQRCGGPADCHY